MKEIIAVFRTHIFLMNKCVPLNGDNIFHAYGPITEIVKSYEIKIPRITNDV